MAEGYYRPGNQEYPGKIFFSTEREPSKRLRPEEVGVTINEELAVLAWQNYKKRLLLPRDGDPFELFEEDITRYKFKTPDLERLKKGLLTNVDGFPISYASLGVAEHLPIDRERYDEDLADLKHFLARYSIRQDRQIKDMEPAPESDNFFEWMQYVGEKLYRYFVHDSANRERLYDEYRKILYEQKQLTLDSTTKQQRDMIIANRILPALKQLDSKMNEILKDRKTDKQ